MSDGERRLAAIMYTDIVGYTSLTQKDESSTLQALERHRSLLRPLFTSHGGREIKTIGDAFLVEFQSALDAVLCAAAIQQTMRDRKLSTGDTLTLRIGIHVGDVVERENDILGDPVNVASRIEPLAEPGGICMTSQAYEQVKNKSDLPFISLGEKPLKNVITPVTVYKAVMPWERESVESVTELDTRRIAVLPFASMSPDPNDEYFADGMTEEIISTISGVSGLSVISRTSVRGYKGGSKKVKEIGKELDVGTIVEGSLRRSGSKIRVTAQLIDVATDGHLWSQTYDRDVQDVFAIQSDIAQKIADSTKVRLLPSEKERIGRPPTTSIAAYDLYLKALHIINNYEMTRWPEVVKLLEDAIGLDGGFASAIAELGNYYVALSGPLMPYKEAFAKAEPLVARALELDPESSDAHVAKGNLAWQHRLAYAEADREFRLAIQLNPNNVSAYVWRAQYCMIMGHLEEALELCESLRRLDPVSRSDLFFKFGVYWSMRAWPRALANINTLVELEPKNPMFRLNQIATNYWAGNLSEARRLLGEFRREKMSFEPNPTAMPWIMAVLGEADEARRLVRELEAEGSRSYMYRPGCAVVHLALGEPDRALDLMEEDFEESPVSFLFNHSNPAFDPVRQNPRFISLVSRLNLPKST